MRLKNFVIIVNGFLKKHSKNCMGFVKHLLPFLPKTLIMMTKSDVIIERVALPIVVQTIGIGNRPITMTTVRTKSMQKKSL